MTDIIQNIKLGDQKAFELLYREYYSRLCSCSYLITKDNEASIEIVQEFFIHLWENRNVLEISSMNSYMFRAIRNNSIRYANKKQKFETIDSNFEYEIDNEFTYDEKLYDKLEESLSELPPKCKEIFILNKIKKQKYSEIATKLNISPRTVEVQIRKASLILREKLKDYALLLFFLFFK